MIRDSSVDAEQFKYARHYVGTGVPLRILFVGQRILPVRHSADKNFWLDMMHGLLASGHDIQALSIMLEDPGGDSLPIRAVRPIPIFLKPDPRFNQAHEFLAGTNNYASKTTTLPWMAREIRRLRKEFRPDVVHFMDNYGPGLIGIRAACGRLPMAISAPTYQRAKPLYDLFLLTSFRAFDAIVPFSDAYRRRLLELQVPSTRIRRIRWGVDVRAFAPPSEAQRESARRTLGIADDRFVVLWTGFIQQTDEVDLQTSVRVADLALRGAASRFEFVFCFKPEHFKDGYRKLERPGLRVLHHADGFRAAQIAADALLSPIHDTASTAAPPLVWLESMAMGIPIITTHVPGSDEVVLDGRNGVEFRSPEEAVDRLRGLQSDPELHRRFREGAREVVAERFSVDRSLREYIQLWSDLADRST